MYRITTYSLSRRTGRPCKRTELLQRKLAVAGRIRLANDSAAHDFSRGLDDWTDYIVLAEEFVNGEWMPLDSGDFWTCELTSETMIDYAARHKSKALAIIPKVTKALVKYEAR
jgi:hypothetical protein